MQQNCSKKLLETGSKYRFWAIADFERFLVNFKLMQSVPFLFENCEERIASVLVNRGLILIA